MEWISVKDRLPEAGENVWLNVTEDYQQVGWYCRDSIYVDGTAHIFKNVFDRYVSVTHWMPLPEPPQEVSDDL